jgi:NTE family protein
VGAGYASERKVAVLENLALGTNWQKLARLTDLNLILLWKGFVHGDKVKSLLNSVIRDVKFEDLEIPFAAIATDAQSVEEFVIKEGSVIEAVRASISIPAIFTPVKLGDRFLVDGGVVNPLPVDVVRNMGAEVAVAVNVLAAPQQGRHGESVKERNKLVSTPHSESTRLAPVKKKIDSLLWEHRDKIKVFDELSHIANKIYAGGGKIDPKTPNIFEVLVNSFHAMEYEKTRLAMRSADIVISPNTSHIGAFAFYKGEEAISQGYKAAKDVLPRLQELIRCP